VVADPTGPGGYQDLQAKKFGGAREVGWYADLPNADREVQGMKLGLALAN
jgi:hypothetical protein